MISDMSFGNKYKNVLILSAIFINKLLFIQTYYYIMFLNILNLENIVFMFYYIFYFPIFNKSIAF